MLNFTLKQLRYVDAAGRLGSIANAATELNISQSSITAAIDALETQLGYDLFVRTPAKGIQATPSGLETQKLISEFLDQSLHFASEISSIGGDTTGLLRIACYATAAPAFLPLILKSFTAEYPGISVKLLEGNMEATMDYLNQGQADLAFTYDEVAKEQHAFEPLFGAPPYALVSAESPLAEKGVVTLPELCELPMVMLDLPRTKTYFINLFSDLGLEPNVVHSTRSAETTRALVSGGFGFSILNICPPDYHDGGQRYRVLAISDDIHVPIFGIATQQGARQPMMVRTFIDHCKELGKQGVFDPLIVT